MSKQVLSIGNCDFDNGKLSYLLEATFQAKLMMAEDLAAAQRLLSKQAFALVVVNRLLEIDGSAGLDIIRELQAQPEWAGLPIMLVTNFAEYEAQALELGAKPGFGKATLHTAQTHERLAEYLSAVPSTRGEIGYS